MILLASLHPVILMSLIQKVKRAKDVKMFELHIASSTVHISCEHLALAVICAVLQFRKHS